ncbi:hypothetical protein GWI33_015762 [Rhynchophorus ferrugineus]|uniref:Uncharacterized protein n=1 Tax=Rhynchophorus ferrugineus TaxID=354439 RepID=A0A834ICN8_RHYFE|nr:hypothetical protein GWI33_015762 [Rhynchophorus ferrugineus]
MQQTHRRSPRITKRSRRARPSYLPDSSPRDQSEHFKSRRDRDGLFPIRRSGRFPDIIAAEKPLHYPGKRPVFALSPPAGRGSRRAGLFERAKCHLTAAHAHYVVLYGKWAATA